MVTKLHRALLLVLVFSCQIVLAQEQSPSQSVPKIGQRELSGTSRIKPRTEQFVLFRVKNGKKQPVSILTREIKILEQNGEKVISVRQQHDSTAGSNVDTSIVRQINLSPLSYEAELTDQKESFTFTPHQVDGIISPAKGESKKITESLKEPVLNAVIQSEIVQSLSLKVGYVGSVKMYNPGKAFLEPTFRVVRSEGLKVAGKTIEAWVVEVQNTFQPTTMWISKGNQELLILKTHLRDGSDFLRVRIFQD